MQRLGAYRDHEKIAHDRCHLDMEIARRAAQTGNGVPS